MQKYITLYDRKFLYTLRRSSRARRLRLTVYADGSAVVTSPIGLAENIVEKFVASKGQWLASKLHFFAARASQPQSEITNRTPRLTRRDYLRYKEQARELVLQKVAQINRLYDHSYNKISIRNQQTCWGSCSRKGNLNFNYKILFLPERAQDYVIAHELCHLKEFNHSKRFWELVARTSPDYLEVRRELKRNGLRGGFANPGVEVGAVAEAGAGPPPTLRPASPAGARVF
jgi:predicted metal-dependent hydrolase